MGEQVVAIGHGEADFERARIALTGWKHFEIGWVEAFPKQAVIEPGAVVGPQQQRPMGGTGYEAMRPAAPRPAPAPHEDPYNRQYRGY